MWESGRSAVSIMPVCILEFRNPGCTKRQVFGGFVTRLSAPDTVLWFRVAPTVGTGLFLVALGSAIPDMGKDRAWGAIILLILFAIAAVIISLWRSAVYEVWLSDDKVILKRGRQRLLVPLSNIDSVEVPVESFRFSQIAWMHWTDSTGAHRRARFPASRVPEWENFRAMLASRHRDLAHVSPPKALS